MNEVHLPCETLNFVPFGTRGFSIILPMLSHASDTSPSRNACGKALAIVKLRMSSKIQRFNVLLQLNRIAAVQDTSQPGIFRNEVIFSCVIRWIGMTINFVKLKTTYWRGVNEWKDISTRRGEKKKIAYIPRSWGQLIPLDTEQLWPFNLEKYPVIFIVRTLAAARGMNLGTEVKEEDVLLTWGNDSPRHDYSLYESRFSTTLETNRHVPHDFEEFCYNFLSIFGLSRRKIGKGASISWELLSQKEKRKKK